jgi:transposase-like protein
MGRARRTYTDDQKAQALELYAEAGPTAVEKAMGIPKATVTNWGRAAGVKTVRNENAAVRMEAARLTFEERRVTLAHALLDDVNRLRAELFAPVVQRQAMTVSDGQNMGSHVEIVDIHLDEPTFGEKKAILTSIGIAVDKVQLLSGAATSRTEVTVPADEVVAGLRDELAERRARQAS